MVVVRERDMLSYTLYPEFVHGTSQVATAVKYRMKSERLQHPKTTIHKLVKHSVERNFKRLLNDECQYSVHKYIQHNHKPSHTRTLAAQAEDPAPAA